MKQILITLCDLLSVKCCFDEFFYLNLLEKKFLMTVLSEWLTSFIFNGTANLLLSNVFKAFSRLGHC